MSNRLSYAAAVLGLLASGCGSAAGGRAASPDRPVPVNSLGEIKGQWDVARFEGQVPQRLNTNVRAAFADFGASGVSLRLECNYSGAEGKIKGGIFAAKPDQPFTSTAMSCGPERDARDGRYFGFFQKSPSIVRIGTDRLRLRNGKTELILERPALRRLQFVPKPGELVGRWKMMQLSNNLPGGGYAGIGLSENAARITITANQIILDSCPDYAVTYRLTPEGKVLKLGGQAPEKPGDCQALSSVAQAPALPRESGVLQLLHQNPQVESWTPHQVRGDEWVSSQAPC